MSENKINFEESIKSLESIIETLEKGECSLEQSIALFEQGMKNITDCKAALSAAECKIQKLGEQVDTND